jgi:LysM repeat protein
MLPSIKNQNIHKRHAAHSQPSIQMAVLQVLSAPFSFKTKKSDKNSENGSGRAEFITPALLLLEHQKPNVSFFSKLKALYRKYFTIIAVTVLSLIIGIALVFASNILHLLENKNYIHITLSPGIDLSFMEYMYPDEEDGLFPEDLLSIDTTNLNTINFTEYRINENDTISGIAHKFKLELDTIISFNQIEDARRILVGDIYKIPSRDGLLYTVRRGDNLSNISKSFDVALNDLLDANNLDSDILHPGQDLFVPGAKMRNFDLKKVLGELFIYPVTGRLTSTYGMRKDPFTGVLRFHNGIDIANSSGSPIQAAMQGTVATIGTHPSYGKYVILSHSEGYQTWYAHLSAYSVKKGQYVSQGQKIGEMGNTGYSTGSHLHFSIFKRGNHVDPLKFLH